MTLPSLAREAVLRIGEVTGVEGRRIFIRVDNNKNVSHMFLDGDIITNIAVNSFLSIRKGYLSIIGRVEGERIEEEFRQDLDDARETVDRNKRVLTVALSGYIDQHGRFSGGTRELPLVGNEAFLLSRDELYTIHDLVRDSPIAVSIGTIHGDDIELRLPVDGLFNSHIAVFGNTGSGKSNTLALLYQELVTALAARNEERYRANTSFLLFDFNGEYARESCITPNKRVYSLSTRDGNADKLPLPAEALLDAEVIAILADATEKTQKPFLTRALRLLARIRNADNPVAYLHAILRDKARLVLTMSDKVRAFLLVDHFRSIVPETDNAGEALEIDTDLDWHNSGDQFRLRVGPNTYRYFQNEAAAVNDSKLYKSIDHAQFGNDLIADVITTMHLQIITDVLSNRAQNEHIAPMILRLVRKKSDIKKMFDFSGAKDFWVSNFVVINLDSVNLDMRKTIPLLISKRLYADHKRRGEDKTLSIIIDEAHNILSTESFREAESWKDYRLETFEEIIKEGRKFGVFVTIASQRPSDISATITSQAHNYFIHRLINHLDLQTIGSTVSYIDRVTQESIPTLPTGTCIFSGVAGAMPVKLNVRALTENSRPQSATRRFSVVVPPSVV